MLQVLAGLNPEDGPDHIAVYLDDIVVFSKDLAEAQGEFSPGFWEIRRCLVETESK